MRQLRALIAIYVRDIFAYRSALLMWVLIDLIGPISLLAVWIGVYQHQPIVGGFSESQMIAYYLGVIFVTLVVTVHEEWDIREDIRYGRLRFFLAKPLSFPLAHTVSTLVWRFYTGIIAIPLSLAIFSFIAGRLGLELPPIFTGQFWVAMSVTLALWLSLSHLMGYLSFFFERPSGIYKVIFIVRWLVSGSIIPLALFPDWARQFLSLTPFPYFYSFPIEVFTQTLAPNAYLPQLATSAGWVVLFSVSAYLLWQAGVRRYDAPEGVQQS